MLKLAASLWSADLANLAAEIRRVEPYCDRFHLDVADGHYVKALLFFPDLVAALRAHTRLPFEVHLMTTDPLAWVEPFAAAGADSIIFCQDTGAKPARLLDAIKSHGKRAGVSLRVNESVALVAPYLRDLDVLTMLGTEVGIKGVGMDLRQPARIRQARNLVVERELAVEIEADGGIRRETVPLIHAAGADAIVPGSLIFREDPAEIRRWIASLDRLKAQSGD